MKNWLLHIGLSLTLVFLPVLLSGQDFFSPGYIITNENDTVRGRVQNIGDLRIYRTCYFFRDDEPLRQEYSASDISGYGISDTRRFRSFDILLSGMNERVFLEYLFEGNINLLVFNGKEGDTFYISSGEGAPVALTHRSTSGEAVIPDVAVSHFGEDPLILEELLRVKPDRKNLADLFRRYHAKNDLGIEYNVYSPKKAEDKIRFGAVVSYNLSRVSFSGFENNLDFSRSFHPAFGVSVLFPLSHLLGKNYYAEGQLFYAGSSDQAVMEQITAFRHAVEKITISTSSVSALANFRYSTRNFFLNPLFEIGVGYQLFFGTETSHTFDAITATGVQHIDYDDVPFPGSCFLFHYMAGIEHRKIWGYAVNLSIGGNLSLSSHEYILTYIPSFFIQAGFYF